MFKIRQWMIRLQNANFTENKYGSATVTDMYFFDVCVYIYVIMDFLGPFTKVG